MLALHACYCASALSTPLASRQCVKGSLTLPVALPLWWHLHPSYHCSARSCDSASSGSCNAQCLVPFGLIVVCAFNVRCARLRFRG
ncbi:hypothetical protein BDQ12DRAFT_87032 [Crucibulum laeve]|uniref:Uncharacterized protein n=1 Tax=Crucibulum laeve TaxID=68775 RepID=A0A5C3M1J3_9AGAR|nr:hypothetical protein BDQ12DRAFT_87032 [Crucibulum laeve]